MQNFLKDLAARGLVAQTVFEDELNEALKSPQTVYCGMDPTAPSLHVGHLLPTMLLSRWQRAGHRIIAVMGGGTALVGDPTGKTEMRSMLQNDEIDANIARFKTQLESLLDLSSPKKGIIVNNASWLKPLNYLQFLREVGSQFSVNRMLTAECFKSRLEGSGLSFLEFNYMVLQAYDFLHLYRNEGCAIQIGGDDQWSNMLAGADLIRRFEKGRAFCITNPLLTTSDGRKMGKTESGAVWLDPKLTPPFDYFQYWRNTPDDMVKKLLCYFTYLPLNEIEELSRLSGAAINEAKTVLAFEATAIVHGKAAAEAARTAAAALFSGAGSQGGEPEHFVDAAEFKDGGRSIVDVMVLAGIVASKGEARRLIEQGGIALDGKAIGDFKQIVDKDVLLSSEGALLRRGKKHYYRLRLKQ